MAAPVRSRGLLRRRLGDVAAAAGHTLRLARPATSYLPGLVGPLLVCYGMWLAWAPLGFMLAGVFLLALDRRQR